MLLQRFHSFITALLVETMVGWNVAREADSSLIFAAFVFKVLFMVFW